MNNISLRSILYLYKIWSGAKIFLAENWAELWDDYECGELDTKSEVERNKIKNPNQTIILEYEGKQDNILILKYLLPGDLRLVNITVIKYVETLKPCHPSLPNR